jgi:uncharacterized protein YjiS (DUF1127 family)
MSFFPQSDSLYRYVERAAPLQSWRKWLLLLGRKSWVNMEAGFRELAAMLERAQQRRRLLSFDDRMLKDIGLSRADAWREASKPLWKE